MTRVVLLANTSWYLYHYRKDLMHALRSGGFEVVLASPRDAYSHHFEEWGFPWWPIRMDRRGMNPFRDRQTCRDCLRLYREMKPDLVHNFTLKPVLYGTMAARKAGVPAVINSITGLGYLFSNEKLWARVARGVLLIVLRQVFRAPRLRVIFQNPDDLQLFVEEGILEPHKAELIRSSGVDIGVFQEAPEPDGEFTVGMASRMLWHKGVGTLVDAAHILRDRGVQCRICLAGATDEGNPSAIPDEVLQQWSAEANVDWVGHVEDVQSFYQALHVAALPSLYREGVPRMLIEAGAIGRALLASDIPGCREVVLDGVNGYLLPPGDSEALAAAIETLAKDVRLRREMAHQARALVEAEFSSHAVNTATLAVYRALLEQV